MKNIAITLILALSALASMAQIESAMPPRSSRTGVATAAKGISIAPPPASKSAIISDKGHTYFGHLLSCDINFLKQSAATPIDGGTVYKLELTSQGAYSIGLRTEDLNLADGCELYLYNNDQDDILGALTSDNNPITLTRQIQGDTVNIELFVPQGVTQKDFKITRICYDYANAFGKRSKTTQYGASCNNEVNINCDEGAAFQDIKHAVVLLSIDDGWQTSICTGTLVNNTQCDQTPYILTAAHCICNENTANNTVVYFNFEVPSCETPRSQPNNYSTMTGTSMVATAPKKTFTDKQGNTSSKEYSTMDFTLLRLKKQIPEEYQPYFAGVSISEADHINNVAAIHHPQGDVKKISISHDKPYQDNYPDEDKDVHYKSFCHWHISRWDVGTTEGGSSGGPLLNENKQVIGILSGGYADCKTAEDDFFQMISKAWYSYSASENQLKAHLAAGSHISEILPYNPYSIGEKYLAAKVEARLNDDSTIVELTWEQMQKSKASFNEDFENIQQTNNITSVFLANVDMDNDRSAWTINTDTAHTGSRCIMSSTAAMGYTNDYLTLPKMNINTGDTLIFWAMSADSIARLNVSQNNKPSRYKQIISLEIDTVWREYKIPLGDYAGTTIYINISHVSESGCASAVFIDDISICNGFSDDNAPQISGYEIYCNNELLQAISDTATRSFEHHLERGNTYTYYIINQYNDGAYSNIGNSIVIDLDDSPIPTAARELTPAQTPLIAYPNPTTGAISIAAPYNIGDEAIMVYDMTGRKVMSQRISNINKGDTIELSLAALRTGVYIIRLGNQTVKIQKQ